MADFVRQTAKICRIGHLTSGNYIQKEGWNPNYVETAVGEISRVNLMAIVVAKDNNNLTLDDGSGKIVLRSFGEMKLDFEIGDVLIVIGRPRIYNGEMYVASEIVRKLENPKWLEFRKAEVELMPKSEVVKREVIEEPKILEETITSQEVDLVQEKKATNKGDSIIENIRNLDKGDGADIEDVVKGIEGGDKIVTTLLEEGEIFEIKPGKVKVLE